MSVRRLRAAGIGATLALMCACSTTGGSNTDTGGPEATTASPSVSSATTSSNDTTIGTWQTPSMPAAAWIETYRRAGGTAEEATAFQQRLGDFPGSTNRATVRLTGNELVIFEQSDRHPPAEGWAGTYTKSGSTVQAVASDIGCHIAYSLNLMGKELHIRVLSDGPADIPDCGPSDLQAQRTILETAPFQRLGE